MNEWIVEGRNVGLVTWAWFGGVDFEEEHQNAEKMGHVTGEPEDVHRASFAPMP